MAYLADILCLCDLLADDGLLVPAVGPGCQSAPSCMAAYIWHTQREAAARRTSARLVRWKGCGERDGEGGGVHTWRRFPASNGTQCKVFRRCDTRLQTRSAHRSKSQWSLMAKQECTAPACRSRSALVACGRRGSGPGRTRRRWESRCAPIRPRPGHAAAYGPCPAGLLPGAAVSRSLLAIGARVTSCTDYTTPLSQHSGLQ